MNYYPISIDEIKEKIKNRRIFKESIEQKLDFNVLENVKTITNEYGETLTRVDGDIPVDLPITNGQRFLFISYDQSRYSHGIHKYPAKFFPELPRWIIRKYSNELDNILDPFSGSATTNVEAILNRRNSVGIDVDPFSRFISRVKTTPINPEELKRIQNKLLLKLVKFKPSLISNKDIPDFPYRDNWFNKEILEELTYIKKIIEDLDTTESIKDFYKVCFSSIIRSVSNADDNCTRTVIRKKLNKNIYPSFALTKFAEKILINTLKIIEYTCHHNFNVKTEFPINNDARYIDYNDGTFDLSITSPPYVNAVDYPRTHQLEIYWLGLMSGSLSPLKKSHVGTEVVHANEYKELHTIGEPGADKKIQAIFKKDPRRAYIAYKFLCDMKLNIKEVYRTLKKNSRYVIVIGNNKIRGELFESWKYLMPIAEKVGFKIESYFGSEIIKHFIKVPREERINTDWVIVLKK